MLTFSHIDFLDLDRETMEHLVAFIASVRNNKHRFTLPKKKPCKTCKHKIIIELNFMTSLKATLALNVKIVFIVEFDMTCTIHLLHDEAFTAGNITSHLKT